MSLRKQGLKEQFPRVTLKLDTTYFEKCFIGLISRLRGSDKTIHHGLNKQNIKKDKYIHVLIIVNKNKCPL